MHSLEHHPFLSGIASDHLAALRRTAREWLFEPGEIILREDEPALVLYLIFEGSVAIELPRQRGSPVQRLDTLTAGDIFGWSWLFAPYCSHFHVRALTPTRAVALQGATLLSLCDRDPVLGHELMKRMAQLLARRLHAAQLLIGRMSGAPRGTRPRPLTDHHRSK